MDGTFSVLLGNKLKFTPAIYLTNIVKVDTILFSFSYDSFTAMKTVCHK